MMLDFGYSTLDAGYSILDAGCWMVDVGWFWGGSGGLSIFTIDD